MNYPVFSVNFGVAPLLFVQVLYGHFFYASSILMAVFWLAVIPLLIAAYYAAYLYGFRFGALGRAGAAVIGLDFVRTGYLAPVFSPDQLKVVPQYGPMVMFAVTLVAGISALAWMILKAKEAASGASERKER
jgi:hypothetical protein